MELKTEEKKGFKRTEVGLIPEDWVVKKIGDIAPLQRGFDLPKYRLKKGNYPVVYSNGIQNFHNEYMVKGPGVVTGRSGTLGNLTYVENDFWPHNTALWVTEFYSNHPKYIYYLYGYIGLDKFGSGSGVPTLNRNDVHDHKIPIPSTFAEQQAIATALSDADELIRAVDGLIQKKEAIKKGTMQQLLTGNKRLPGFDGEWEVKALGDIINRAALGGNYSNSETSSKHPLIKMGNLGRGSINLDKAYYVEEGKLVSELDKLKYGDLLFNTRNTPKLVGKVAIWRNELSEAYYNSNLMKLEFDTQMVASNFFMNYLLNTDYFIEKLQSIATGTTSVAAIYTRDLFGLEILLPKGKEQKAIAQILSDMDEELQSLRRKREKMVRVKEGMMQELLTGKTRLV